MLVQGRNNRVGKVQGAPEPRGPRVSGKKYRQLGCIGPSEAVIVPRGPRVRSYATVLVLLSRFCSFCVGMCR